MKVKEVRELSTEEINKKLVEAKEELFNLRFQQATGNLEKPSRIRDLRHTVARYKTVLKERETGEQEGNKVEKKVRKDLVGKVVSATNDKTITVLVETYKNHPLYHKRVKSSKKYCVHDEKNIAKVGDTVRIVETRPLSKTKHFYLKEIVKEAVII